MTGLKELLGLYLEINVREREQPRHHKSDASYQLSRKVYSHLAYEITSTTNVDLKTLRRPMLLFKYSS